jgi:hypothetical protein
MCALHVHCMCTACALHALLTLHMHCSLYMHTCSPVGNKHKKAKPTEEAAAAEEDEEEANDTLTSPGRESMSPSNFIASASNF